MLFILLACAKPKATVFEDKRLSQEDEVKFCFLGDLGMDTDHQKAIASAMEREGCQRIFFLGDLVYPAGIQSADDPLLESNFLKYYRPLLEKNPDLIFGLLLGNHDHQGDPKAWIKLYQQEPSFFFPHYYYFVDYGGLCVVALDTSFYYYNERVAEALEQTTWLTKLEPRLKDCDVKVALSHHPFKGGGYSGSKDWEGAQGALKTFLDTYVIGKFDIHLAGHVHILQDDGKDEGTRMLISGTGGENRGDGASGYIVLRWDPSNPKRVGYSLRKVDTITNVYNDPQLQEDPDDHWDHQIRKSRVENPWYEELGIYLKSYFQKN